MRFPDPLSRRLVQLLDGTRDREMLTRDLIEYVRSGRGEVLENGVRSRTKAEVAVILERRVHEGLESLAREGMLVVRPYCSSPCFQSGKPDAPKCAATFEGVHANLTRSR